MDVPNSYIADKFSLLAKLMDIHGENSFKAKSYSIASFTIDKLPEQLASLPSDKIFSIKGIGEAIGKKIQEIQHTGELRLLDEYVNKTPAGVIEMLNLKGLGPKKIATIWNEMGIETVGELEYACNENRLLLYKGFGEKTQKNLQETIAFYLKNKGSFLYAEILPFVRDLNQQLMVGFPAARFEITGEFRRQMEIINQVEWVTTVSADELKSFLGKSSYTTIREAIDSIELVGPDHMRLLFHICTDQSLARRLFLTSGSEDFLLTWNSELATGVPPDYPSEEALFAAQQVHFIPAFQRERPAIIDKAKTGPLETPVQRTDIRGIIHSHSNWSDGSNTIEEMALACKEQGFEYLVISDHSKSAFYANGLSELRIREQHGYVDELNQKLHPFRIFKSIECDILNDGHLDYTDNILSTFDLVITSIHSNLKMSEEKAMTRLLGAIENPYTVILGHPTGRLLLSRPGYPVDFKKIIDVCADRGVVIELNAHPRRLDIDWRRIDYALERNVLLSIDPDAHSIDGFQDIQFGVLVAQKAGLTSKKNLSSFSLAEFDDFLNKKKALRS